MIDKQKEEKKYPLNIAWSILFQFGVFNALVKHSIMAAADSAVILLELNVQWD